MADAQANAPGATSSQAQILFSPHDDNEKNDQKIPFRGGGTASAQSTGYSGQSQSQLQGKFNHGIKYTGSAQSSVGSKDDVASFRNRTKLSFDFATARPFSVGNTQSQSSHSVNNSFGAKHDNNFNDSNEESSTDQAIIVTTPEEYEYEYVDNDDEEEGEAKTKSAISQSSTSQRQHIILDPLEDLDATVVQSQPVYNSRVVQPGQQVPGSPGFYIPKGFRGKISSVASPSTASTQGPNSFAQSVTLSPGTGRITYKSPLYAISSNSQRNSGYSFGSGYSYQPTHQHHLKSGLNTPKFVSVTKSEAGSQNLLTGKKTPSVYYSQSSTCGFFTNTCVFNNGKKICMPKPRTNPDGSPMAC